MTKDELQAKARLKIKQRVQKSRRIKREKKDREGKRDPVTLRQIKPAQDTPDLLREGVSISVIDNPDIGVLYIVLLQEKGGAVSRDLLGGMHKGIS